MARVLVVDDDTVLGKLYKSSIVNIGHEVEVATDGEEGLKKVEEFKPQLILTDIMMPRMDGLAFLKAVKSNEKTKDIPVIVMTNLNDEVHIKTAKEGGAVSFVLKNEHGPAEIVKAIKECFANEPTKAL